MALLFLESWDHFAQSQWAFKWSGVNHGGHQQGTTWGRFGSAGMQTFDNRAIYKDFTMTPGTLILGAAVRIDSGSPVGAQSIPLVHFYDSGTLQTWLAGMVSGQIRVMRGATVLATSADPIPFGVFQYLEMKTVFHASAGSVEVKLDGVTFVSVSGVDTTETANLSANRMWLGQTSTGNVGWHISWDDIYLADGSGSAPQNDYMGDCRVQAVFPNGNGNSSQFDGSDGNSTDNYLLVDETTPNSDTDYVESATISDKDTYGYGALASSAGTVYGVQILPFAKRTESGSRSIVSVARSGATEEDGPAQSLGSAYLYKYDIRETKPGGGAWAIADVNAAEFGVKIDS